MTESVLVGQGGSNVTRSLQSWANKINEHQIAEAGFIQAFEAFDDALVQTVKYLKQQREGASRDETAEDRLTSLWNRASMAVYPFDAELSNACSMKGLGWTDSTAWKRAKSRGAKISIEDMENARAALMRRRHAEVSTPRLPSWFSIAGVLFAAITIAFLMFLLLGPEIGDQKKTIFDVLVAFCAAASASFLGGSAVANGRLPFVKSSPISFSAYGGIGVLVVVFLLLRYFG